MSCAIAGTWFSVCAHPASAKPIVRKRMVPRSATTTSGPSPPTIVTLKRSKATSRRIATCPAAITSRVSTCAVSRLVMRTGVAMIRRRTPRCLSATSANATEKTASCMMFTPRMPGTRKSTYRRRTPCTDSSLRPTTGAVCVTANDNRSMTDAMIWRPTATCWGRASSPYTVSCGTVWPGRAGAMAKSDGITINRSSSVRFSFVRASAAGCSASWSVSIPRRMSVNCLLALFFAWSSTAIETRPKSPRFR